MGGMNFDIFPVKKKVVLTQLNISEAEASSEHFYKHGPFHTDNGQHNVDSIHIHHDYTTITIANDAQMNYLPGALHTLITAQMKKREIKYAVTSVKF
jgi:ribose 5-phosphate isomerase